MQLRGISAVLIAGAILAAGCGSTNTGTAATSGAASTPPSAAAASPSTAGLSSAGSPQAAAPAFASAGNCRQLAGLGLTFERAIAAAHAGPSNFAPSVAAFRALANAAPAEIRRDLQVVANAVASYASALTKLGLKPNVAPSASQIPAIYGALQAFGAAPVRAAVQRIGAWVHQNCGPTS